ncbi:uncharacterized protein LOC120726733 [Simochromis diagramma]|uniref:uncharacterized protein LOC120726733 n=1 Tax=Simochromis diagramma TaxID=43689 RepID=UPI001A7EE4C7|nr:uncharacterized protein LOC120726733 [Simochromis diagramma]
MTMVFNLSAGSLAVINQKKLAELIEQISTSIKDRYNIEEMYAVAASVPKDEDQVSYDFTKVTPNQQTELNDGILRSPRLVVATKKKVYNKKGDCLYTEHAEWRVLQNLNLEGQDGDLLVFFSHASPCAEKCADPDGKYRITDQLRRLFNGCEWGAKAFVFNVLFRPPRQDINPDRINFALTNIGIAIDHENLFRCNETNNGDFHCIKCFNGSQINPNAYKRSWNRKLQAVHRWSDEQSKSTQIINHMVLDTIHPLQFAYRPNRSVDDATAFALHHRALALALHHTLQHLKSSSTYVRMLFLDYSSAFNTIRPGKLIEKLSDVNIPTLTCNWILDFLTERPQVVRIGGRVSAELTISTGSPQGCCLSPKLFTLYTHDCVSTQENAIIIKYANNTTILGLINRGYESGYRTLHCSKKY